MPEPEQDPKPMSKEEEEAFESPQGNVQDMPGDAIESFIDDRTERRMMGGDDVEEPEEEQPEAPKEEAPEQLEASEEEAPAVEEAVEAPTEEPAESEEKPKYDPVEALRLRLDEADARSKLLESQIGRRTGNEGFLKQQLEQLKAENLRLKSGEVPGDDYETERQVTSQPQEVPSPQTAFLQKQAMEHGARAFLTDLAGPDGTELSEEDNAMAIQAINLMKTDPAKARDWSDIHQSGDPEYAVSASRDLLTTTFWALRREHRAKLVREYEQAQVDVNKRRKLAAAVSQSTVQRPSTRRVVKTAKSMTDKELESHIPS